MKIEGIDKVLIIGSGPIVIGQACEFDYSGTQACKALREQGYKIVLVNSNPATIMTDPVMADATYIEPLNVARLTQIIEKERPQALLPNLGGQTGLNLASALSKAGVLDTKTVKSSRKPCRSSASILRAPAFATLWKKPKRSWPKSVTRLSFARHTPWVVQAAVSATTWKNSAPFAPTVLNSR